MRQIDRFKSVFIIAFLFGVTMAFLASRIFFSASPIMENVAVTKVFFTSFNAIILAALTYNYYQIYAELPTETSRALLIFSAALFLYALTSSPVMHVAFGFEVLRIGLFTYIPHAFVSIAALVILYESYR